MNHLGRISSHRATDVGRGEQPPLVQWELAEISEVLDIQVRRERGEKGGWGIEWIGKCVRYAGRHDDDRAGVPVDSLGTADEVSKTVGTTAASRPPKLNGSQDL